MNKEQEKVLVGIMAGLAIAIVIVGSILVAVEMDWTIPESQCERLGYDRTDYVIGGSKCCKDVIHSSGIGYEERCTGIIE